MLGCRQHMLKKVCLAIHICTRMDTIRRRARACTTTLRCKITESHRPIQESMFRHPYLAVAVSWLNNTVVCSQQCMLEEGRKYVDMYKVERKCTCDEANSGPSVMQAKTGMRHPYLYIVNCSRGLTIYIYI